MSFTHSSRKWFIQEVTELWPEPRACRSQGSGSGSSPGPWWLPCVLNVAPLILGRRLLHILEEGTTARRVLHSEGPLVLVLLLGQLGERVAHVPQSPERRWICRLGDRVDGPCSRWRRTLPVEPGRVSRTLPGSPPHRHGAPRLTSQFLLEALLSPGETMSRSPDCLLWLLRSTPSQRGCTLFIISFKFMFLVSVMIYWHIEGEPRSQGQFSNLPVDVPCPHLVPPARRPSTPPPGNIFFLETSDRTNPNFLFMCSVESAARAHPEFRVAVLMKGLRGGNASLPRHLGFSLLSCFPNVQMLPLDLEELFRDTPLAAWYVAARRRWEPYLLPVLSDASRLALLWKFGGIYLDTDFIVLQNLRNLTNTLGTQSHYVLNGAFLAFERHHEFLALCMRDFVAHYNRWIWGHQGPQLLTRVFKKWCSIRSLGESHACRGVTALPSEAFYPIPWQNWKKYFEDISPEELPRLLRGTYAVHVWNKKSQGTRLEATSRALLAQLHARYCPTTHKAMKMYL